MGRIDRLGRSFKVRADLFVELLESQKATTTGRQSGVSLALTVLVGLLHRSIEDVDAILSRHDAGLGDDDDDEEVLVNELHVLRSRIDAYDSHFARQSRGISPAIDYLLMREAAAWSIRPRSVIVTVGEPDNFAFGEPTFGLAEDPDSAKSILAISVPRIEGSRASWLPIILGHEFAHYLMRHSPVPTLSDMQTRIEAAMDQKIEEAKSKEATAEPLSETFAIKRVADDWLQELICDAYAVAKFGPAGYAAMTEHLGALGEPNAAKITHPPSALRAQMMRTWLSKERSLTPLELSLVARFEDVLAPLIDVEEKYHPILDAVKAECDSIWAAVTLWLGDRTYWSQADPERIEKLTSNVLDGVPPIQVMAQSGPVTANPTEIINAAWHASTTAPAGLPVDELAMKALDDFHFIETWEAAKGNVESKTPSNLPAVNFPGVLANSVLRARVNGEISKTRITMTPLMENAIGDSSVDIRLGNQFIVFDRTAYPAFDSFSEDRPDPRSMQHKLAKAWGEVFYLHPGQLVLAAALEYLVMPADLSAQVITRSSFGRLGLISATAVQVHPGYKGCLTLELVNLGEIPIAITPGERIAQLMFFQTNGEVQGGTSRYRSPVGPEFSKVTEDTEWKVLNAMRSRYRNHWQATKDTTRLQ